MATLQFLPSISPKLIHIKNPNSFSFSKKLICAKKLNGVLSSKFSNNCKANSSSSSGNSTEIEECVARESENERPPFDINLAVILAGFAFEAYTTPPEKTGNREMDGAQCQTVFLSEYVFLSVSVEQI